MAFYHGTQAEAILVLPGDLPGDVCFAGKRLGRRGMGGFGLLQLLFFRDPARVQKSGVHGVFGVAPAILSPVFFPVRTTHRRQEGALWAWRYYRAVRIKYARIHASGAGFPELFTSCRVPTQHPILAIGASFS
jgi:hypothetical protein